MMKKFAVYAELVVLILVGVCCAHAMRDTYFTSSDEEDDCCTCFEIDESNKPGANGYTKTDNSSLLFEAVRAGNLTKLKDLFNEGCSIKAAGEHGMTLLQAAMLHYRKRPYDADLYIVKWLVENDPECVNISEDGDSPLHMAARYMNPALVKFLVENDAYGLNLNSRGMAPFHVALREWDKRCKKSRVPSLDEECLEIVKCLVDDVPECLDVVFYDPEKTVWFDMPMPDGVRWYLYSYFFDYLIDNVHVMLGLLRYLDATQEGDRDITPQQQPSFEVLEHNRKQIKRYASIFKPCQKKNDDGAPPYVHGNNDHLYCCMKWVQYMMYFDACCIPFIQDLCRERMKKESSQKFVRCLLNELSSQ